MVKRDPDSSVKVRYDERTVSQLTEFLQVRVSFMTN